MKTLHPRVHGGLLYKRGNALHEQQAREQGFQPIDLVVVNLYPFEATIAKPDVTLAQAIEQIDIGGPSMIRSAAKNKEPVTVVVDREDYSAVLGTKDDTGGQTQRRLREELALKAVLRGETYLSPAVSRGVVSDYVQRLREDAPQGNQLTPRQREVLQLIAEGHSTKEIARRLDLSVKTVDTHRTQWMQQLDIHEVAGLVRYAMRTGLISPDR